MSIFHENIGVVPMYGLAGRTIMGNTSQHVLGTPRVYFAAYVCFQFMVAVERWPDGGALSQLSVCVCAAL